jgi:hypothetical protein
VAQAKTSRPATQTLDDTSPLRQPESQVTGIDPTMSDLRDEAFDSTIDVDDSLDQVVYKVDWQDAREPDTVRRIFSIGPGGIRR